jgi:hypothetical protein
MPDSPQNVFEHSYDVGMGSTRAIRLAWLTGSAGRLGHRHSDHIPHTDKVAELREQSTEPDELAEAAAAFLPVGRDPWPHEIAAVQLLIDAGADVDAIERHAEARRQRPRGGFSLGSMAEGINAMDSAHGRTTS